MSHGLQSAVQRALSAWDTTTLKTAGDGMLCEAMESLRVEFDDVTQSPAVVAEPERDRIRAAQITAVMPLIGPLLDAWEQADREVMADEPELVRWLNAINTAMETAGEGQP